MPGIGELALRMALEAASSEERAVINKKKGDELRTYLEPFIAQIEDQYRPTRRERSDVHVNDKE